MHPMAFNHNKEFQLQLATLLLDNQAVARWTVLLRANRPKGRDAEYRGYDASASCQPGRQRGTQASIPTLRGGPHGHLFGSPPE